MPVNEQGNRMMLTVFMIVLLMGMSLIPVFSIEGPGEAAAATGSPAMGPEPPAAPRAVTTNDITLFLHNVTDVEPSKSLPGGGSTWNWFDTETDFNAQNTTIHVSGTQAALKWYLAPALAASVNATEITLKIWMMGAGANPGAQTTLKIFEKTAVAENIVWTKNLGNLAYTNTAELKAFIASGAKHTFAAGSSILVELDLNTNDDIYVMYDSPAANSRVVIPTSDHIDASILTLDSTPTPQTSFSHGAGDKTLHFRTSVTDPSGGYDIVWVNLTVLDPAGAPVIVNQSMFKISGTPIGYTSVYNYTWDYTGYDPGRYDVIVWLLDNSGYNHYHHFGMYSFGNYSVESHSYFYIGGLPKFVWVRVQDSLGEPMEGALVSAMVSGVEEMVNTTNATGLCALTVNPGDHDFTVTWQGIVVGSVLQGIADNVTVDDPVVVDCSVYYPVFRALDNSQVPIKDAAIYVIHPNGTALLPVRTDSSGDVTLSQFPEGVCGVVVRWRGIEVSSESVTVDDNVVYPLNCAVYYATVTAVNTDGDPLDNILVTAYDNATGFILDFMMTDVLGVVVIRVPSGTIDLVAFWQNIPVNETFSVDVVADVSLTLVCSVFAVDAVVQDAHGAPVEGAQVNVRRGAGGDIVDSAISDGVGRVILNLIGGTFHLEIYWQNVMVNSTSILITGESMVLNAAIYYITFSTADSRGVPVAGAMVSVSVGGSIIASNLTDAAGLCHMRLPAADVDVAVTWRNTQVFSSPFSVTGDAQEALALSVYYATFSLVDFTGAAVSEASLYLYTSGTGELVDTRVSDHNGTLTVRLPLGSYDISVLWRDVLVGTSAGFVVSGDVDSEVMDLTIYYVTFRAMDARSEPLEGAAVYVDSSLTGQLMDSGLTSAAGELTVRMPGMDVDLSLIWDDVVVYTEQDYSIGETGVKTIDARVFYVTFAAMDDLGEPVAGARLSMLLDGEEKYGSVTGGDGGAELRVPGETYDIEVYWRGIIVYGSEGNIVDSSFDMPLPLRVYHVVFHAVDGEGEPVDGAHVTVLRSNSSSLLSAGTTDAAGDLSMVLPLTTVDIIMTWWMAVEVFSASEYSINSSHTYIADCRIFYLNIKAMDSGSKGISGVAVTVVGVQNGIVTGGKTGGNGEVSFRLPEGEYKATLRLQDTVNLKKIDETKTQEVTLSDSTDVDLKFSDYPPSFTSTPAFYAVTMPITILALLLLLIIMSIIRKRKKARVADEGEDREEELVEGGSAPLAENKVAGVLLKKDMDEEGGKDGDADIPRAKPVSDEPEGKKDLDSLIGKNGDDGAKQD